MNVLQVFNEYRSLCGGEGTVVQMIAALIEKRGGTARLLSRSSKGLDGSVRAKMRAFVSGIYNRTARHEMAAILREDPPDVVHVHNVYPLFSPSVLMACRRAGVPVVMTNHNYVLSCPVVNHLHKGRICERCVGGHEYWCALNNCRGNSAESIAYAVRSAVARRMHVFRDCVTVHILLSDFAKKRLVRMGFDETRLVVLPNMVELPETPLQRPVGEYIAYSGRIATEKGIDVLLAAARQLPDIPFRLAGDGPLLDPLRSQTPPNVRFVNRLGVDDLNDFYKRARVLVVPSMWFEGCPLVVSEAMSHSLPVVASRIGGLPEFVDESKTGLLFEPGDVDELVQKIRWLWDRPAVCLDMGQRGSEKARREYNADVYYQRLMAIYGKAMTFTGKAAQAHEHN